MGSVVGSFGEQNGKDTEPEVWWDWGGCQEGPVIPEEVRLEV